jgi:hypothetical protein
MKAGSYIELSKPSPDVIKRGDKSLSCPKLLRSVRDSGAGIHHKNTKAQKHGWETADIALCLLIILV